MAHNPGVGKPLNLDAQKEKHATKKLMLFN
jgi:hypothetical protein